MKKYCFSFKFTPKAEFAKALNHSVAIIIDADDFDCAVAKAFQLANEDMFRIDFCSKPDFKSIKEK